MWELPIEPPEQKEIFVFCPSCGKRLYGNEEAYEDRKTGEIVGCSLCLKAVDWYVYAERLMEE